MCRVLIIEDDAVAALDIQSVLESSGATAFGFAESLKDAQRSVREARPAIITSDVMLGSDFGPHIVKTLIAEIGEVPVLYITATPEECQGCPPDRIFEKPFDPDRLARAFRALKAALEGGSTPL